LFGNLLSSIGKIELNYYIISIAIVINIISNYYLIPLYGIKGAAITSAILMWFTGILSWLSFLYFFRKNRYE
jgi:O-antigen/teichoic acid export membrane protein